MVIRRKIVSRWQNACLHCDTAHELERRSAGPGLRSSALLRFRTSSDNPTCFSFPFFRGSRLQRKFGGTPCQFKPSGKPMNHPKPGTDEHLSPPMCTHQHPCSPPTTHRHPWRQLRCALMIAIARSCGRSINRVFAGGSNLEEQIQRAEDRDDSTAIFRSFSTLRAFCRFVLDVSRA